MINELTHGDFRIMWHDDQNEKVMNIPKAAYLEKLSSKEFGGDNREVNILKVITIDKTNAAVHARLTGEKAVMSSIFSLTNLGGDWKIVQELVTAEFVDK